MTMFCHGRNITGKYTVVPFCPTAVSAPPPTRTNWDGKRPFTPPPQPHANGEEERPFTPTTSTRRLFR
ncbi:MAG TPA: hypothetical protein PLD25_07805 [Chloroflexota bacterium]|nr:hypothetical protein [Chloroflexota bacterium]HUM69208.1 hypothetical protein [Chloroflexota bacterium]